MFLLMKISSQFSHACKLHAWVMPIIIFVFCACSNDIKIISDFPINQKLKGRQIKALDSLYNAYSIIKLDSKYLLTLKGEDHFVDRKSTRLNSSHANISYAVFCLKQKNRTPNLP